MVSWSQHMLSHLLIFPSCISSDTSWQLHWFPPWTRASWDHDPSPSEQLQLAHEAEHASWLRPCFCLRSVYFFSTRGSTLILNHHLLHFGKMEIWLLAQIQGGEGALAVGESEHRRGTFAKMPCILWTGTSRHSLTSVLYELMDLKTWDWHSTTKCLCFACSSSCEGLNSN